jgi:hypothetical protein
MSVARVARRRPCCCSQPTLARSLPHHAPPPRSTRPSTGEIPLDVTFEYLCSYLAELTLLEYGMLNFMPSQIAASCVLLALHMLGKRHWTDTLTHYCGYVPRDLRACTQVRPLGTQLPLACCMTACLQAGVSRPAACRTSSLTSCLRLLQAVHSLFLGSKSSNLPACREKYCLSKHMGVANLGAEQVLPEWLFQ